VEVGAAPPDADGLLGFAARVGRPRQPVRAAIESMNGARFVHDRLELAGWEVEIADALKVKGLAPLACKTDRIDAWVGSPSSRGGTWCRRSGCPTLRCEPSGSRRAGACIWCATAPASNSAAHVHVPRPVEMRLEAFVADLMDRARDLGQVTRGEVVGTLLLAREVDDNLVATLRFYRAAPPPATRSPVRRRSRCRRGGVGVPGPRARRAVMRAGDRGRACLSPPAVSSSERPGGSAAAARGPAA